MKKYVIERDIPGIGEATPAELRSKLEASNEVLAQFAPDVQWLQGFVLGNRTVCVYLARDAQLLRQHGIQSGYPAARIDEVLAVMDPSFVATVSPV